MAGIWLAPGVSCLQKGSPRELIEQFEREIGRKTIGNKPPPGTEIIKNWRGAYAHGVPDCLYRRATARIPDAAHEMYPIAELTACAKSRANCSTGPHKSAGSSARPFTGTPEISGAPSAA